jgi:transcriptional regulator GlxA family with amidase domain
MPQHLVEDELSKLQVARPDFINGCHISRSEPATVAMIYGLVNRMMRVAANSGGGELGLEAMERTLVTALILALDDPDPALHEFLERTSTRQATFLMALDFALHHINKDIYVSDLCGATGIAERSLRQLFQEFTTMSPITYLNLVRMKRARQLLVNGDPAQMSVKYAALDSGFWDLGRFALKYKSLFGESPSSTLAGLFRTP